MFFPQVTNVLYMVGKTLFGGSFFIYFRSTHPLDDRKIRYD